MRTCYASYVLYIDILAMYDLLFVLVEDVVVVKDCCDCCGSWSPLMGGGGGCRTTDLSIYKPRHLSVR